MKSEEFYSHLRSLNLDETLQADTVFGASFQVEQTVLLDLPVATTSQSGLKLGKTIGEGGMGVVRSATQMQLHREVAVKTLRESPTQAQCSALLLEALITGGLQHPSIVPVYSLAQSDDGLPIIVMKLVEGVTWLECIEDPSLAPGMDLDDVLGWHLEVLSRVCQAVHFAHSRQIVHRDIKPENIMLGEFGEVYLVDWGIALTTDIQKAEYLLHTSDAKGIAGTPAYMAPEMTFGEGQLITPQTDVYLLGATLAQVITGKAPHSGKTLFELLYRAHESVPIEAENTSEQLLAICHKAMAPSPEARYSDVSELRRAIQEHLRHRASIRLTDNAIKRLEALSSNESGDGDTFRNVTSEIKFGLNEALNIWPENSAAIAARSQWFALMVTHELSEGHVTAAWALLAEADNPSLALTAQVESAQLDLNRRESEVKELEEFRVQTDLSIGARFRVRIAIFATVVWTLIPLIDGFLTGWGANPVSHIHFVMQSAALLSFVALVAFLFRRKIQHHFANRQIITLAVSFCVVIPLYRIAVMVTQIPVNTGLALELGIYGLMFGGIAILSSRSGLPIIIFYGCASIGAAAYPDYVEAFMAASNFFAFSWLGWIWANLDDPDTGLANDETPLSSENEET